MSENEKKIDEFLQLAEYKRNDKIEVSKIYIKSMYEVNNTNFFDKLLPYNVHHKIVKNMCWNTFINFIKFDEKNMYFITSMKGKELEIRKDDSILHYYNLDKNLYKNVHFMNIHHWHENLSKIINNFSYLKVLKINTYEEEIYAQNVKELKCLSINCHNTPREMENIIRFTKNLEIFYYYNGIINTKQLKYISRNPIKKLSIQYTQIKEITYTEMIEFFNALKQIKILNIRDTEDLIEPFLDEEIKPMNLEELTIDYKPELKF